MAHTKVERVIGEARNHFHILSLVVEKRAMYTIKEAILKKRKTI
jgi:hypothetical protein